MKKCYRCPWCGGDAFPEKNFIDDEKVFGLECENLGCLASMPLRKTKKEAIKDAAVKITVKEEE